MSEKYYLVYEDIYGYGDDNVELVKIKDGSPETVEKALLKHVEELDLFADDYRGEGASPWPKARLLTVSEEKKVSLKSAILSLEAKYKEEDEKFEAEQAKSIEKRERAEYARLHAIYGEN